MVMVMVMVMVMQEGKKIDVLGLKTKLSKIGRYRSIDLGDIKKYRLDGTKLDTAIQTKIPVNRDFRRKQSNHKTDQSMKTDHSVLLFGQMLCIIMPDKKYLLHSLYFLIV